MKKIILYILNLFKRDTLGKLRQEAQLLIKQIEQGVTDTPIAKAISSAQKLIGTECELEGTKYTWQLYPYEEQVMAVLSMWKGNSVELATGEGKTLVIALYATALALSGQKVHIATANAYLAHRDAEWMAPLYKEAGISVGVIPENGAVTTADAHVYECDVVYGTATGLGFDYLRTKGIINTPEELYMDRLETCIVDEADSVLIDEAGEALIISGAAENFPPKLYDIFKTQIEGLIELQETSRKEWLTKLKETNQPEYIWLLEHSSKKNPELIDYLKQNPDLKKAYDTFCGLQQMSVKQKGTSELEKELYFKYDAQTEGVALTKRGELAINPKDDAFTLTGENTQEEQIKVVVIYVLNALLKAYVLKYIDEDYIVKDGNIAILDQTTGRVAVGREWGEGLHQALQAKEGLEISSQTKTYAKISKQNFFGQYDEVIGLSGTLKSAEGELSEVYGMTVEVIPTHKKNQRCDHPDRVFKTDQEKYEYVYKLILELQKVGRPILIGGSSIEQSEELSAYLKDRGILHEILNAKNPEAESKIVANAGQPNKVTIATNMAGRGTDIKLDPSVQKAGGLYVIGLNHDIVRVDNQLRGRAGRQGDPGDTEFLNSLTDKIILNAGAGGLWTSLLKANNGGQPPAIIGSLMTRVISKSQLNLETEAYGQRKHKADMDSAVESVREHYYAERYMALTNTQEFLNETVPTLVYDKEDPELTQKVLAVMDIHWVEFMHRMEELEDTSNMSYLMNRKANEEYAYLTNTSEDEYLKNRNQDFFKLLAK